jgi:hypothetical protein
MILIFYPTILLVLMGWLYAELDPWFKELCCILLAAVRLELIKIPMLIKLEWDVFWMKRNTNKYLKMAKQIRKDLDEANNEGT